MNKAQAWLKDPRRDYAEGIAIYKEAMGNDKALQFFNQVSNAKPGTLHFNMLMERMQKVSRVMVVKQADKMPDINTEAIKQMHQPVIKPSTNNKQIKEVIRQRAEKSVRITDNPFVDISQLPDNLKENYLRIKAIPQELAGAHGEMKASTTNSERAIKLKLCKDLEAERKALWKTIDDWWTENKGNIKEQEPEATADLSAIDKRLETLRKAINRAENELKAGGLDAKKKAARKEKIAAWKQEQKELQKLVK
jgi:uncharacterized protein YneF (UPF0154 family)